MSEKKQPIRFCDFMLQNVKFFPNVDYRFVNETSSKSFHHAMRAYAANMIFDGRDSEKEMAAFQLEINLWRMLALHYNEVFKLTTIEKFAKLSKAVLFYRVVNNVNPTDEDRKLYEDFKRSGQFKVSGETNQSAEELNDNSAGTADPVIEQEFEEKISENPLNVDVSQESIERLHKKNKKK